MAAKQPHKKLSRDLYEYDYAEEAAEIDEYDPFEDTSYVTCYPGAESTYRLPWHDPDMNPVYYAGEIPVYRWTDPRIVEDKERVLVYEGERLVGEFPTHSIITLSHYSGGRYFYANSCMCQFEFAFEESKDAKATCDLFMRIGII